MSFSIKDGNGLTVNVKTATIKLEKFGISRPSMSNEDLKWLKSLAILLGGYNKFGRNIPLDQHKENVAIFKELITKISNQLD